MWVKTIDHRVNEMPGFASVGLFLPSKIGDFAVFCVGWQTVRLDLANRVADAVRKQDVREFHTMINNLAAKHLVAIQVLGYALGLLVGFVQLAG